MRSTARLFALTVFTVLLSLAAPQAQTRTAVPRVTTPEQFFGHEIGADYVLPNYTQFTEYWRKLDAESDRMMVQSIGKTAEGRDQLMAIITSPENNKKLERYKEICAPAGAGRGADRRRGPRAGRGGQGGGLDRRRPARHRGARRAAADRDRSTRWSARTDEETLRILDDVIILSVHANPDGMELVADWYMRKPDPKKRSTGSCRGSTRSTSGTTTTATST